MNSKNKTKRYWTQGDGERRICCLVTLLGNAFRQGKKKVHEVLVDQILIDRSGTKIDLPKPGSRRTVEVRFLKVVPPQAK